jgi:hypothetical protein
MARCLLGRGASAARSSIISILCGISGQDIAEFARELIVQGVSLDAEASLINDPPPTILGIRGQWWSRKGLKPFSDIFTECRVPISGAEPDNTALM